MKLNINKACDLNSISVLPPHSRSSYASALEKRQEASGSQIRSMSQQSFSQGMNFSQLSQSSFDEPLLNDQRLNSQERDSSSKKMALLAPTVSTRDDSQLQLSRTSNNALQRWKLASASDNSLQWNQMSQSNSLTGQINQDIEHRFRQIESSLSRLGMVLDSIQSDVMQVNRAVKEVSIETEGIRHKLFLLDNSMQQVVKAEENIKAFVDGRLKSLPDHTIQESEFSKINDIASTVTVLPKQIEASLLKLQHELCKTFMKEAEVLANEIKSFKNHHPQPFQLPEIGRYISTRPSQRSQEPTTEISPVPRLRDQMRKILTPRMEAEIPKALKPKQTNCKNNMMPKHEEIPLITQDEDIRIIISDDENDEGLSSLLMVKKSDSVNLLMIEAKKETMRILRKARKRKRSHPFVVSTRG